MLYRQWLLIAMLVNVIVWKQYLKVHKEEDNTSLFFALLFIVIRHLFKIEGCSKTKNQLSAIVRGEEQEDDIPVRTICSNRRWVIFRTMALVFWRNCAFSNSTVRSIWHFKFIFMNLLIIWKWENYSRQMLPIIDRCQMTIYLIAPVATRKSEQFS